MRTNCKKPSFGFVALVTALGIFVQFPAMGQGESSSAREDIFQRAMESMKSAQAPNEFLAVAGQLEQLIGEGYENGVVFWNLGDAYMRAGRPGRALAAYRQAERYLPRDIYLKTNREKAQNDSPGRLPNQPGSWWRKVFFWQTWVSYPEKFTVTAVFWTLVFGFGLLFIWKRKTIWRTFAIVAAVFSLIFSISAYLDYHDIRLTKHGVVIAECTARKGSDDSWPPAFDKKLLEGAECIILNERGQWIFVRFEGIGEGWVPKEKLVVY